MDFQSLLHPLSSFRHLAVGNHLPNINALSPISCINRRYILSDGLAADQSAVHIIHFHLGILQGCADVQHILPWIRISHRHSEASIMGFFNSDNGFIRKLVDGMLLFK